MVVHTLHTISGILAILLFFSKVLLHYYLDYKHKRNAGFLYTLLAPLPYFLPYKTIVDKKYLKLKHICNFILVLLLLAIFLNIACGI